MADPPTFQSQVVDDILICRIFKIELALQFDSRENFLQINEQSLDNGRVLGFRKRFDELVLCIQAPSDSHVTPYQGWRRKGCLRITLNIQIRGKGGYSNIVRRRRRVLRDIGEAEPVGLCGDDERQVILTRRALHSFRRSDKRVVRRSRGALVAERVPQLGDGASAWRSVLLFVSDEALECMDVFR